jgi:hypothetical protein
MPALELELVPGRFTIAQLATPAHAAVLLGNPAARPAFAAVAGDEVSVVCPTAAMPRTHLKRDDGWELMRVRGQLDFTLVGVLANLTAIAVKDRGSWQPVFQGGSRDRGIIGNHSELTLASLRSARRAARPGQLPRLRLSRRGARPGTAGAAEARSGRGPALRPR